MNLEKVAGSQDRDFLWVYRLHAGCPAFLINQPQVSKVSNTEQERQPRIYACRLGKRTSM